MSATMPTIESNGTPLTVTGSTMSAWSTAGDRPWSVSTITVAPWAFAVCAARLDVSS